jgi:hypothetical protein
MPRSPCIAGASALFYSGKFFKINEYKRFCIIVKIIMQKRSVITLTYCIYNAQIYAVPIGDRA